MLTSNAFPVFISILALLTAVVSAVYNFRYTKTNSLFAIQKLVFELAKDCNAIHKGEADKIANLQINRPTTLFDIDFYPTLIEIVRIIDVLDTTLVNYKQSDQKDFFMDLFWLQLHYEVRVFIEAFNSLENLPETTVSDSTTLRLMKKLFAKQLDKNRTLNKVRPK